METLQSQCEEATLQVSGALSCSVVDLATSLFLASSGIPGVAGDEICQRFRGLFEARRLVRILEGMSCSPVSSACERRSMRAWMRTKEDLILLFAIKNDSAALVIVASSAEDPRGALATGAEMASKIERLIPEPLS